MKKSVFENSVFQLLRALVYDVDICFTFYKYKKCSTYPGESIGDNYMAI